ncbi:helix-turn-helix domain-containing protein [Vallitalea okinawensis]|uniref:helix-turn-helix domain-containing protein n=1 Tax=Vallitalea okinawensis TaxID=2078660 RepID=UPI000CFD3F86|nr:AraC family transcriptional regulator [Vallitalea okinawensis]
MISNYTIDDFFKNLIYEMQGYQFKLNDVYNIEYMNRWELPHRQTSNYRLMYIRQGSGHLHFPDRSIPLEKGRVIFFSPLLSHHSTQKDITPSLISINFGMKNRGKQVSPPQPYYLSFIPDDLHYYHTLFEKLAKEYHKKGDHLDELLYRLTIKQILAHIYTDCTRRKQHKPSDHRIEAAKTLINKNITCLPTITELCEKAGLSQAYFSKLFKSQVGMTPKHYMYSMKMDHGKYLLTQMDYSVKETALTLGYSDPYIFSNQFKKAFGYPPSLYKHFKDD